MAETDVVANLPAPLSLTLEEASKIAAGSSGLIVSAVESWWWKGQPAFAFLNPAANPVVTPGNVAVGQLAGR